MPVSTWHSAQHVKNGSHCTDPRTPPWGATVLQLLLDSVVNPNEYPFENFTVFLQLSHQPKSLYHTGIEAKIFLM